MSEPAQAPPTRDERLAAALRYLEELPRDEGGEPLDPEGARAKLREILDEGASR